MGIKLYIHCQSGDLLLILIKYENVHTISTTEVTNKTTKATRASEIVKQRITEELVIKEKDAKSDHFLFLITNEE